MLVHKSFRAVNQIVMKGASLVKKEVEFETYQGLMGFKKQQRKITLQDCSVITLNYSQTTLEVIVEGNDSQHIDDIIYGIWELCCFFDGYFYKPIKYVVNNRVELPETLIRLDLYKTDEKWIKNGLILRKDDFMPLNKEIIEAYYVQGITERLLLDRKC